MECFRLLLNHLAWIEHQFLSGIKDSRKPGSLWGMMRGVVGVRKSELQSWLAKRLGLLCWGFNGVQEEIPSEEASTLQIGSVAFPQGQCTSQQLHPCHWLFEQDGQFLSLPIIFINPSARAGYDTRSIFKQSLTGWNSEFSYSPELAPCDFCLFPKPQMLSLLWDNWGDERGCDEGHWHAHTRGLPWGLPEVVGTMQQVHCSRRRLLWKGQEFHVCTINKSAHTKKVWKLI